METTKTATSWTRCVLCGLDVAEDPEAAGPFYWAVARDADDRIRALAVNLRRSETCRHQYWIDRAFDSEGEAAVWLHYVNAPRVPTVFNGRGSRGGGASA